MQRRDGESITSVPRGREKNLIMQGKRIHLLKNTKLLKEVSDTASTELK